MPTITEVGATLALIIATLKADSALMAAAPGGVHHQLAPEGNATPFVTVALVTAPDVMTQNKTRVYNSNLWLIKGVAEATKGVALDTIAARIDALFGRFSGQDANAIYIEGYREEQVTYPEVIDRAVWIHHGARVRLGTQLK